MIKAWSKTQSSISLSSAEAMTDMVKLSTELIGLMSLARDLNCRLHGRVWADSSAALAIVKRSGAGKLRRINVSLLWVQEQQKLKKLVYEKVPGQDNPADLFTKAVGREKLQQFAWASGQTFLDGRAEKSLQAQGVSKASKLAHGEFTESGAHAEGLRASKQISWRLSQGGGVGRSWWPSELAAVGGRVISDDELSLSVSYQNKLSFMQCMCE